jgi:hypothetical protein
MMQNKFLQDFMRSQQKIIELEAVDKSVKKDKKGNRKSKHGTANGKHPFGDEDAFATLVKEKPGRKEVLEYFRGRIAELVAADMA